MVERNGQFRIGLNPAKELTEEKKKRERGGNRSGNWNEEDEEEGEEEEEKEEWNGVMVGTSGRSGMTASTNGVDGKVADM